MIDSLSSRFPKKSFIRNFSLLMTTNLLVTLISMITGIYIARVLTPVHYGEYGVILSIIGILQVISSLGLGATVTRTIARNQENSLPVFRASLLAYFAGFVLSISFLFVYKLVGDDLNSLLIIVLVIFNLFLLAFWNVLQNVAFGMQRMEFNGIINLIMTIVILLSYFIIPTKYISVAVVMAIGVISLLIKDLLYYYQCKKDKLFTGKLCSNRNIINHSVDLVKQSVPFLVMGLFSMLSNQLPILFLNFNSGPEQVAFFNTANKLLLPISLIITTAMTAMFPNLSQLFLSDKLFYMKRIKTALISITILGVFGAITVSMFRSEIVSLIYGSTYKNTGLVLAYQCWFMVAFAIFNFLGGVFSSSDKQKLLSYLSICYGIVSVPILWIGSKFSAEYLSLAFTVSAIINMTYHWFYFQKTLPSPFSNLFTAKLFISILVPFTISILIPESTDFILKVIVYITIVFTAFFFGKESFFSLIKNFN